MDVTITPVVVFWFVYVRILIMTDTIMQTDSFMAETDAANYLGVSVSTLRSKARQGVFSRYPHGKGKRKSNLYKRDELEFYRDAHRLNGTKSVWDLVRDLTSRMQRLEDQFAVLAMELDLQGILWDPTETELVLLHSVAMDLRGIVRHWRASGELLVNSWLEVVSKLTSAACSQMDKVVRQDHSWVVLRKVTEEMLEMVEKKAKYRHSRNGDLMRMRLILCLQLLDQQAMIHLCFKDPESDPRELIRRLVTGKDTLYTDSFRAQAQKLIRNQPSQSPSVALNTLRELVNIATTPKNVDLTDVETVLEDATE